MFCKQTFTACWRSYLSLNIIPSVLQARVSLPGGLTMHSIPGRQVCIDTGLPPFFHMPPPVHAHAPAPSSPQPSPSPHSSHIHKVGAGCHKHTQTHCQGKLVSHTHRHTHKFTLFSLHIFCFSSMVSILCQVSDCALSLSLSLRFSLFSD